jgi:hypothetical protein
MYFSIQARHVLASEDATVYFDIPLPDDWLEAKPIKPTIAAKL